MKNSNEDNIVDPGMLSYDELESDLNEETTNEETHVPSSKTEIDSENSRADASTDLAAPGAGSAAPENKTEVVPPMEQATEKTAAEELRALIEKQNKIIENQKAMIDRQGQEVGLSRKLRDTLPVLTEDEKLVLKEIEEAEGFASMYEKYRQILDGKEKAIIDAERTAIEEQAKEADRREAIITSACPEWDNIKPEMEKILTDELVPEDRIRIALEHKGSSDPAIMIQVYKRALEVKNAMTFTQQIESHKRQIEELKEALKKGDRRILDRLEKVASVPPTMASGGKNTGFQSPKETTDDPGLMSYNDLDAIDFHDAE